ncbi:LysE family translocator [Actinoallomurus bryophytorum]|nr:LysE family translocator [Actinoallomurus bryophytorum]
MLETLVAFAGAAVIVALVPGPSTAVVVRKSMSSGRRAGVAAMLGNESGVVLWGLSAALGLSALLLASRIAYDTMRIAGAVFLVSMGARSLWRSRRANAEATTPTPASPADAISSAGTVTQTGPSITAEEATTATMADAADLADPAAADGTANAPDAASASDLADTPADDTTAMTTTGVAASTAGTGAAEKVSMPAESRWRAYRLGLLTNLANPKAGVFAVSFLPQFVPDGARVLPVLVVLSLIWALIDMIWYLSLIWLAGRAGRAFARPSVRRRVEQLSGVVLVGLGLRIAAESR